MAAAAAACSIVVDVVVVLAVAAAVVAAAAGCIVAGVCDGLLVATFVDFGVVVDGAVADCYCEVEAAGAPVG